MQDNQSSNIAILMAVYNGADYLDAQLSSFAAQTHKNWQLLASDDGSSDASHGCLERLQAKGHQVDLIEGPGQGAAMNFLHLIRKAPKYIPPGSWLAFSDQDDIWLPRRLSQGYAALLSGDPAQPALYCSRTLITDEDMQTQRLSAARPRKPGFQNALVQNIASGNTILLNPAATQLVLAAAHEVTDIVIHDWWIYLLITGAGGRVVHSDTPTVQYRQHGQNQIGANDHLFARLQRIWMILRGTYRTWNNLNIAALRASKHRLAAPQQIILEDFAAMRRQRLPKRLLALHKLKLYRQTSASTIALWLAAIMRRL